MFEFLFKYPAEYFAEGRLITALPWWQLALLPLAIALTAFVALGYFRLRAQTRTRDRMTIALLRGMALGVIIFSLTQPLLEVTAQTQQE
jgi:ABC-type Mn2+/Zn2+ transport system permease subunit